ncbi:FecR family protein [Parabacteroides pacaensis]|uniref:FecR family protein n=1 Tax=Parabacteroides pacaensis TaxID=2086575 RepID=UPI00131CC68C|nr:FecR domain-containing protein [Parabacteroides pacaensis]
MEKKNDKIDLLHQQLINEITPEQKQELTSWKRMHPNNGDLLQTLQRIELSPEITANGEEMRESILTDINRRIDKLIYRKIRIRIVSIAASILFLVSTGIYLSYFFEKPDVEIALLELQNNTQSISSIILSDSTKVSLNVGSTLFYPEKFTAKSRNVQVEGEAFFQVTHNPEHPFVVNTKAVKVQVFGTKFNIKTNNQNDRVEVTLLQGSLGVHADTAQVMLEPGEQAVFNESIHSLSKKKVDTSLYLAWYNNKFHFKNETLENIARQLEQNFNIQICITPERLKYKTFTGDFHSEEKLEEILHIITFGEKTGYTIESSQVHIFEK